MAVRNCLECQQAQFKHGVEASARNYTAMPSTLLGAAKSATAQASNPDDLVILNIFYTLFLFIFFFLRQASAQKIQNNNKKTSKVHPFFVLNNFFLFVIIWKGAVSFVLFTSSNQVLLH